MPNGYRRGGQYRTRSGATAYRRGTSIRAPRGLVGVGIGLVCLTTLTGGSLIGSPGLVAVAGLALVGLVVWRYRRQLKPVGRRMLRWAQRRSTVTWTENHKGVEVTRSAWGKDIPAERRKQRATLVAKARR